MAARFCAAIARRGSAGTPATGPFPDSETTPLAAREPHSSHERFSAEHEVSAGSDRAFGLVFTAVLGAVGVWMLLFGTRWPAWPWLGAAAPARPEPAHPRILARSTGPGSASVCACTRSSTP
jgi:hypothetical protein